MYSNEIKKMSDIEFIEWFQLRLKTGQYLTPSAWERFNKLVSSYKKRQPYVQESSL